MMRMCSLFQLERRKVIEPVGVRIIFEGIELNTVRFL